MRCTALYRAVLYHTLHTHHLQIQPIWPPLQHDKHPRLWLIPQKLGCTALCRTACIVLQCTALHGTIPYRTVLYCTLLTHQLHIQPIWPSFQHDRHPRLWLMPESLDIMCCNVLHALYCTALHCRSVPYHIVQHCTAPYPLTSCTYSPYGPRFSMTGTPVSG
jgi:hypothetical protein